MNESINEEMIKKLKAARPMLENIFEHAKGFQQCKEPLKILMEYGVVHFVNPDAKYEPELDRYQYFFAQFDFILYTPVMKTSNDISLAVLDFERMLQFPKFQELYEHYKRDSEHQILAIQKRAESEIEKISLVLSEMKESLA